MTDEFVDERPPLTEEDDHHEDVVSNSSSQETSFWGAVRRWLWPTPTERALKVESRLQTLDDFIEQHPDTPSNYVLRGELYLKLNQYALAASDFEQALDIATDQVDHKEWGVVAQAMQDRALVGLQQAQHRLANQRPPSDNITTDTGLHDEAIDDGVE